MGVGPVLTPAPAGLGLWSSDLAFGPSTVAGWSPGYP